ncbi:PREDICTED: ankyrin repeat-containing protein At5g02620-like isoform X2 [Camelina sativa]|uniref:Ankyrin repeat-containing protein At5g02620-like isoform X2 n=1 Tax=Camelina sativa TaxID=90675 RepID=A0ABM1RIQ1_CAMSA|nr:PREDICTED: ankyrin repeat-containing protein At5g02620-like isoform X2 [Camelina sativa]XP_019098890.1 PREDICTED: ankyrin repeat-containing protein At5g02620-like isoform X2 [Camelina sativa]XP_019098891.1 PREDICTED: ankyrin repeat-containing protein At5g02620-like isoform X2 [Camelina sativa]
MEGEEDTVAGSSIIPKKKMAKQLTGKREDTLLHSAVRQGNKDKVVEILTQTRESELNELLGKQNQSGETALYVVAEYGDVEIVKEMIKCYDLALVEIKARNGFDAFHIAAKQGHLDVLKVLAEAHSELAMTVDLSNTTALHTAATQGHTEVVNFLLELGSSLAGIAKSNGKTALHSASRNGHVKVIKALLASEPAIAVRMDKKGQTALHMAVKGTNVEVVEELIKADRSSINIADTKGNTALHIAARKGRSQIVKLLLANNMTDTKAVNRSGETALDTAEKIGNPEVALILQKHGVPSAKTIKASGPNPARELKQTVSDIKHEVHNQLEHTRLTRKRVQGIAKQLNKMHTEGLNNAINSTTVVAVLIATVAFAAIFTVPGQYVEETSKIPDGHSLGEANIASTIPFIIFFIFDSIALFISLAVVVVQTSVVVIESKAKKQMMAVINKLMWLACVLISVAFLALSFVVVGEEEKWLAIWVTAIGATIMITTLGTMCYWIIQHRIEAANARNIRRSSINSKSGSWGIPQLTDSDILQNECKKMYAI